jgi:peptidoglycan/xylan/chitin deacetylase (PgdA/CDA1 family)
MSYVRAQPSRGAPWRPNGFLRGSIALHATAIAATALVPEQWPWMLGAVAANHAALAAGGLLPRARLLGPNLTRLPAAASARREVALTLDDGPDPEVTPRALELLARAGAQASFFCIGRRAAQHPSLVREIVAQGHAVENHSLRHRHDFSLLGPYGYLKEIAAAQETLGALAGSAPRFFRAPAGLRNPFLGYALARLDLSLVSWTRRGFDTVSAHPPAVHARLARGLAAGDILLLHDGHAARTRSGPAVLIEILPRLLDDVAAAGLRPVTLRAALSSSTSDPICARIEANGAEAAA